MQRINTSSSSGFQPGLWPSEGREPFLGRVASSSKQLGH